MCEGVLWVRTTASAVIWGGKVEVFQVNITSTTNAKGVTLYDNSLATEVHEAQRIQTYSAETLNFPFYMGRVFNQGLYIKLDAECTECVVAIRPLP